MPMVPKLWFTLSRMDLNIFLGKECGQESVLLVGSYLCKVQEYQIGRQVMFYGLLRLGQVHGIFLSPNYRNC